MKKPLIQDIMGTLLYLYICSLIKYSKLKKILIQEYDVDDIVIDGFKITCYLKSEEIIVNI